MVCPKIQAKLEIEKVKVVNCFLMSSTNLIFQMNHKMDSLTIDLEAISCTSRKWDFVAYLIVMQSHVFSSFARMLKILWMIVIKGGIL